MQPRQGFVILCALDPVVRCVESLTIVASPGRETVISLLGRRTNGPARLSGATRVSVRK